MRNESLHYALLKATSLLAPGDQRAEWLQWWRSELWYISPHEATLFCLGAFRDALWLRRNSSTLASSSRILIDSPFCCVALLGALSAASIWITAHLEKLLPFPDAHGTSAIAGIAEILFLYMVLAATAFLICDSPGNRRPMPRPSTLRSWFFLILKIGLVLPVLQCTLIAVVVVNVPFLSVGFYAGCVLLFRWVFSDQRRRCSVCLRLLTDPIRIGTPSRTFLQWYGAESMCARGHGFLHAPEIPFTYCGNHYWLNLDDSWKGLFSKSAGLREQ